MRRFLPGKPSVSDGPSASHDKVTLSLMTPVLPMLVIVISARETEHRAMRVNFVLERASGLKRRARSTLKVISSIEAG